MVKILMNEEEAVQKENKEISEAKNLKKALRSEVVSLNDDLKALTKRKENILSEINDRVKKAVKKERDEWRKRNALLNIEQNKAKEGNKKIIEVKKKLKAMEEDIKEQGSLLKSSILKVDAKSKATMIAREEADVLVKENRKKANELRIKQEGLSVEKKSLNDLRASLIKKQSSIVVEEKKINIDKKKLEDKAQEVANKKESLSKLEKEFVKRNCNLVNLEKEMKDRERNVKYLEIKINKVIRDKNLQRVIDNG